MLNERSLTLKDSTMPRVTDARRAPLATDSYAALTLLFDCCQSLLQGDRACIDRLRAQGFVCETGYWQFRLPALHGFVQAQLPAAQPPDYPGFLQQLYGGDLNSRLRELGAEIAIVDNCGKVDSSLYCLRRLGP